MLGPICVIAKDEKVIPTAAMSDARQSTGRGNALAPNRLNSCNQWDDGLLCSIARINDLWDRSLDKRKVCGLVPCCRQGYRAQVPQNSIDT